MAETSEQSTGVSAGDDGRGRAVPARYEGWIRAASGLLIVIAVVLLIRVLPTRQLFEPVQAWIDSLGVWGPLALGVIYLVAALLLIPGSILTLAAGALYGLVLGTVIASLASTTAAAIAFLIARYLARENVRRKIEQSPKLAEVDRAIGEQGWKIVAMLRLSPAIPFNLQNYLYGVTAIGFWTCVLVSWVSMLPGTFLYVYLGSLGRTAAVGGETSTAEWVARIVGLLATVGVTAYLTWLARSAMARQTEIAETDAEGEEPLAQESDEVPAGDTESGGDQGAAGKTVGLAATAVVLMALAIWGTLRADAVRDYVEDVMGLPSQDQQDTERL